MPMNYSTAREIAVLLYDEPLAQVIELKRIRADIYCIRSSDRRDGRMHTILEPGQVVTWLDSVLSGRVLQPEKLAEAPVFRARPSNRQADVSTGQLEPRRPKAVYSEPRRSRRSIPNLLATPRRPDRH